MAKSWTSGGGEEEPLLEKQQVDRPFSGADDGIRTRDPHLGKKKALRLSTAVHLCSSYWMRARLTRSRPATDRGERPRTAGIGARNGANAVRGRGVRTLCREGLALAAQRSSTKGTSARGQSLLRAP